MRRAAVLAVSGLVLVAAACVPTPTDTTTSVPASTGTVTGIVTITGRQPGDTAYLPTAVVTCPGTRTISRSDFQLPTVTSTPANCPTATVDDSGRYSVNLTAGTWSLAVMIWPAYDWNTFGPTTTVTVAAAGTYTVDLSATWPGTGTVAGTVSVDNVPSSQTSMLSYRGVTACPGTSWDRTCLGALTQSTDPTGAYQLALPEGTWTVAATYLQGPSGAGSTTGSGGSSQPVTLATTRAGSIVQDFALSWAPVGTLGGTHAVTGVPAGVNLTQRMYACPGVTTVTETCAGGRSALAWPSFADPNAGNYAMALSPGTWSVAVGYRAQLVIGQPLPPTTIGPGSAVTIVAEGTTTANVTAAYAG